MTSLAFKRASGWYGRAIHEVTGGEFGHVELWLSGPQDKALCYSSRETAPPGGATGSSLATLDLTDPKVWQIVPLPMQSIVSEEELLWFCKGSTGRPYDYIGIAGIGTDLSKLHIGYARFCSDECCNALQQCFGLWPGINPSLVAPSGFAGQKDRYGLYELAVALGAKQ